MEEETKEQGISSEETQVETPPAEDVEALKTQLAETTEKLGKAEKGLKTARATASEKTREAKELRDSGKATDARFDAIEEVLKDLANRSDDDDSKGKGDLDKRLSEIKNKSVQEHFSTLAQEAENLASELGYDIRNSPELDTVRDYFSAGDLKLARKGVTILERMKEKKAEEIPVEDKKEPVDVHKLVEERLQAKLKEMGLLSPEGGSPSSAANPVFTKEQIRRMPDEEYKEKLPLIDEAIRLGRVK